MCIIFLLTYFLSLEALIISGVPGSIALIGSVVGIFYCSVRSVVESKQRRG